jgi:uncharacterized damage-inducible protein DinB
MISPAYAQTMARYNMWQNRSLYGAADALGDAARRQDRGAFFSSIHRTFCHLLWGDMIWLHRFADTPKPESGIKASGEIVADWDDLKTKRAAFDQVILDWTKRIDESWLAGDLTWFSGAVNAELTAPRGLLVANLFNHQTHHRGQVHAMLTAAGAKPDDTDLMLVERRA